MSKPDVRKAVYNLYDDIVRILFGGIIKYIKKRRQEQERQEKEEEEQQEEQGQSSTTTPRLSSKSTVTKSSTGNAAVDIENGNDFNKSNDIDNDDDNNNDVKEDVTLPRMIEEPEYDDNDIEAQSSLTQSKEITFVEHTLLSNEMTNTTKISNDSTNTTITSP